MKYLKVMLENNFVRNDRGEVIESGFIYPAGWDPHKMNVRAYKGLEGGGADYCIAETDDITAAELLKNAKVTELQEAAADTLIAEIRVKPDFMISVGTADNAKVTAVRKFLDDNSMTYQLD